MLERHVVIPSSPQQLWAALTDPVEVAAWFGGQVEWDLRPGGAARFVDDDGSMRRGVVDVVLPGRHLSYRWWRADPDGEEGDDGAGASRVTYTLEPDDDGTRLTVTEQRVADPTAPVAPQASAVPGTWTSWDSRLLSCWARVGAGALVGRPRA